MNYSKLVIGVASAAVFLVSNLNGAANAQSSERYVHVGDDKNGVPFLLDTEKIRQPDPDFGEVIKLYQIKNDLMFETVLRPACGDNQQQLVATRVYSDGVKVKEHRFDGWGEEIGFQAGTPGGEAMRYYCHSVNARGW